MKRHIAIWAAVGVLVVVFWTVYISATLPTPLSSQGVMWTLVYLTCPIALAHSYPLGFYLVLLVNAATYGMIGVAVETIRRHGQTRSMSH